MEDHVAEHNNDFYKQTGLSKALYKHNTTSHDIKDNLRNSGWELKSLGVIRSFFRSDLSYKGLPVSLHVRCKALDSEIGIEDENATKTVLEFQENGYDPDYFGWEEEAMIPGCAPMTINIWIGSYWINGKEKSPYFMIIPDGKNKTDWIYELEYLEDGFQSQLDSSDTPNDLPEAYSEEMDESTTINPKEKTFPVGEDHNEEQQGFKPNKSEETGSE